VGEDFIGDDTVCLVLGDNIFYGHGMGTLLRQSAQLTEGAIVYGYFVNDPERYGVVVFDDDGHVIDIEEKPEIPRSNYAITGIYFYDNSVIEYAKQLKPSARDELEITDLNRVYLEKKQLKVETLGRGIAWLDTGTHRSLLDAGRYVEVIESRQGLKIACVEEIAWRKGYINDDQLRALASEFAHNGYGEYLLKVIATEIHHEII